MEKIYQKIYEQLEKKQPVSLITRLTKKDIRKFLSFINLSKREDSVITDHHIANKMAGFSAQQEENALAEKAYLSGRLEIKENGEEFWIAEPFTPQERLILLGGGHVSLALAEFSAKTGFSVAVADDRPYFANRTRFPWASEIMCDSFPNAIEKLHVTSSDYVVILTRGHRYDGECLKKLYHQSAVAYLGMIGSRRRVRTLKEQLIEEGIEESWLKKLHSPVGLDIGAVTPEEIAIAILAEIIKTRRKLRNGEYSGIKSDVDMKVIKQLAYPPDAMKEMGKAIVTILEAKGSVPRKAGAKMIVYENGMTFGTIGGGCAEARMIENARNIIHTGSFRICEIDMTGTIAEEEGMVCGGTMRVLIEDAVL